MSYFSEFNYDPPDLMQERVKIYEVRLERLRRKGVKPCAGVCDCGKRDLGSYDSKFITESGALLCANDCEFVKSLGGFHTLFDAAMRGWLMHYSDG